MADQDIIKAAAQIIVDAILAIIQDDPHIWSSRPCRGCNTISSLIGKPFGCYEYQARQARGEPGFRMAK